MHRPRSQLRSISARSLASLPLSFPPFFSYPVPGPFSRSRSVLVVPGLNATVGASLARIERQRECLYRYLRLIGTYKYLPTRVTYRTYPLGLALSPSPHLHVQYTLRGVQSDVSGGSRTSRTKSLPAITPGEIYYLRIARYER